MAAGNFHAYEIIMIRDVYSKEKEDLFSTPIVQQTSFWSNVKSKIGHTPVAINFNVRNSCLKKSTKGSLTTTDLLVILKKNDANTSFAYVPHGPEIEPSEENQGAFLEELSETLRSVLPKNCMMIRYDLCWKSYWANDENYFDENGLWTGPPKKEFQELRFNYNTVYGKFRKPQFDHLPVNTLFLDLTPDPESILDQMKPKTRYNIRLGLKRGVTVTSYGPEKLDIWYELYKQTAIRNNFFLHDKKYFTAVLTSKLKGNYSAPELHFLIAELDYMPLAAMFMVISKNRATYLYGASSTEYKKYMASYVLQWNAINLAKSRGCTEYDFFGLAPAPDPTHHLYGLYRYKTGFGGRLHHSLGCWDYPLDEVKYKYFTAHEFKSHIQGYKFE